MENAIVAVTNNNPSIKAKKFLVHLTCEQDDSVWVLADSVFFKDGLVLMEGTTSIMHVYSKVDRIHRLTYTTTWIEYKCSKSLTFGKDYGPTAGTVKYGSESANLILGRDSVRSVEGLSDTGVVDPYWFRTKDEAQRMADEEQLKLNESVRTDNARKIHDLAENRRQVRAYEIWKALPWWIRLVTPLMRVVDSTDMLLNDREWVKNAADKLEIDYGVKPEVKPA